MARIRAAERGTPPFVAVKEEEGVGVGVSGRRGEGVL